MQRGVADENLLPKLTLCEARPTGILFTIRKQGLRMSSIIYQKQGF